jgi:hypothetical protein
VAAARRRVVDPAHVLTPTPATASAEASPGSTAVAPAPIALAATQTPLHVLMALVRTLRISKQLKKTNKLDMSEKHSSPRMSNMLYCKTPVWNVEKFICIQPQHISYFTSFLPGCCLLTFQCCLFCKWPIDPEA